MNVSSIAARPAVRRVLLAAAGSFALFYSCGGGDPRVSSPRHAMLAQISGDVVLPTYRELRSASAELIGAAEALRAAPTFGSLAGAQSAWRRARGAWRRSKAFELGPATRLRTFAKIDFSPVRADRIEQEIRGSDELTPERIDELGGNVKGFLALEYLLFDPAGDDGAVLAALVEGGERRLDYIVALAGDLSNQVTELLAAWEPGEGGYADVLATAGRGNPTYPTLKSAVDDVVNHLLAVGEDVERKLTAIAGVDGDPEPDVLEARLSANEVNDLVDDLRGIENVYRGATVQIEAHGMAGVVEDVAPRVDGAMELSLQLAFTALGALPDRLAESLDTAQAEIATARARSERLADTIEIDLVSALGSTLVFNPGDGD